jgi:energy-converting hydrogenase Eha subunit C
LDETGITPSLAVLGDVGRAEGVLRESHSRTTKEHLMTYGAALVIGAIGAILRYAVADSVEGVDLRMIGLILMIVGAVGLAVGLIQTAMHRRQTVVYDDRRPLY